MASPKDRGGTVYSPTSLSVEGPASKRAIPAVLALHDRENTRLSLRYPLQPVKFEYLGRYARQKRSIIDDRRHVRTLSTFFGNLLLSQITKGKVEEFKQIRKERATFKGTPVSNATCNRELACLRHMLRLAVEEGLIVAAPIVRLYKETGAREQVLSEEDYQRLFDSSPLHLQRILVCAYETGMRAGEIKRLTWDKVDFKVGFIRLAAEDTKTSTKRAIPLSPILRETLEEIRKEQ